MASEDEVRRLILEVLGEEKVRSLREQIDEEKKSLVALASAIPHLTAEEISKDRAIQAATANLARMTQELRSTEVAHRNAGLAALEFSRGMEDLQYGLNGVVNNIPGIVMALGGGAGLTAVILLASVAINQLVKHWGDFTGSTEKAKIAAKSMKDALKEETDALEALDKIETERETKQKRERVGGIAEVVAPHREEIRKALIQDIQKETTADIERREAQITAEFEGRGQGPEAWGAIAEDPLLRMLRRRRAGAVRGADVTIGRAIQGGLPEAARLRGLFGPETEIGAGLVEASQERVEQRRRDEEQVERQRRMAKVDEAITQHKKQVAEEEARAKAKADQERLAIEDAHMKSIEDARKIEEDAKKDAAREAKRAAQHAKVEADHAARAAERQASHEASLIEQSLGDRARMMGTQAIAQGFNPMAVQQQMAKQFMMAGATRLGAQKAAQDQMEKIMVDIMRNGDATSSLLLQQGKLQRAIIDAQNKIELRLNEATGDLQRNWDQAGRRGR